jgi:hypothetical protein
MAAWYHGSMAVWHHGIMAVWQHGSMAASSSRPSTVRGSRSRSQRDCEGEDSSKQQPQPQKWEARGVRSHAPANCDLERTKQKNKKSPTGNRKFHLSFGVVVAMGCWFILNGMSHIPITSAFDFDANILFLSL